MARAAATLLIFTVSLSLVLLRPRRVPEWLPASVGGALMLALRLVTLGQAARIWAETWRTLLFLLALLLFSLLAELGGLFEWAATYAARHAGGSGRRLFFNVFALGAISTILLSLDTTAILLTPIVLAFVRRLRLPPLPFMLACCFIANTGSLLLPVSNLTNLLVVGALHIGFDDYAAHMLLPAVAAILINFGAFLWLWRREIPRRVDTSELGEPADAILHGPFFRLSLCTLGAMVVGYFVAEQAGVEIVWVGVAAAAVLLIVALRWRLIRPAEAARDVSWGLFPFVLGMFILVQGIENLGLLGEAGRALAAVGHRGPATILTIAFGAAAGANVLNNLPMTLLGLSVLGHAGPGGPAPALGGYCLLIGANIGPNLTIVGSLATMLWLSVLRRKGLDVSPWEFTRAGLVTTPAMLLAASLALWLSLRLWH